MTFPLCPMCKSEFVYPEQNHLICPECGFEWDPSEITDEVIQVQDANGTHLSEGDKATVVKDLKIKASSQVIKIGTKVIIKRIKNTKDHELDCRVDGVGEMMITAKFVKKS